MKEPLVIASSICPSYSTDQDETPTYEGLEEEISVNTKKHFEYLTPQILKLEGGGVPVVHTFLMADTEVDLLPFLNTLSLTPKEFTRRCQTSVEKISDIVIACYGEQRYIKNDLPPASRFLDFFGERPWFERYEYFTERLLSEVFNYPGGRIDKSLEHDFEIRKKLVEKLLGRVDKKDGVRHIARQRAQYMAFSSLMRERLGKRLVVANHRTPNFGWMNDRITREPLDKKQLDSGNFLSKLPLIELDISTMPT